jgi:hypothetical protein
MGICVVSLGCGESLGMMRVVIQTELKAGSGQMVI